MLFKKIFARRGKNYWNTENALVVRSARLTRVRFKKKVRFLSEVLEVG